MSQALWASLTKTEGLGMLTVKALLWDRYICNYVHYMVKISHTYKVTNCIVPNAPYLYGAMHSRGWGSSFTLII